MDLYNVSEKEKEAVRALFSVTDEDVKTKILLLKKWIDMCPDLPEDSKDDHYLNIMLLRAKFKDEYVQKNITNYYKTIKRYPEIFTNLGKFKLSEEVAAVIVLPKLTANLERINIMKFSPSLRASKILDLDRLIQVIVTIGTLMHFNDYVAGTRFVLDFDGITFRDLFRVNIKTLYKLVRITEDMLRIRISGIEFYNAPGIVGALLGIARLLLKPKMLSRVTVHKDLTSLHKNIPVECISSDYGGELESTETLIKTWDHIIETQQPFFEKIASLCENEPK